MIYYGNFEEMLEDSLIEELEWLKEEFEFLFKPKKHNPTENDKQQANKMIENFLNKLNFSDDNSIVHYLMEAIESIEYNYPKLF